MHCPSCAAEIDVDLRHANFHVCPYCQTASVVDKEALRLSGTMAVLSAPRGPLFVGAAGTVRGRQFRVLGRVRYGYEEGFWDEWYLRLDEQDEAWISEDEKRLALETRIEGAIPWPGDEAQQPGASLKIGDKTWQVRERGRAICEGGEGQLPFQIIAEEKIPFLDLRSGEQHATLEREADGEVRMFVGEALGPGELEVDNPHDAPDTMQAERSGGGGRRERVVKQAGRSLSIRCDSCGGGVELPDDNQTSCECPHCGNRIELAAEHGDCESCGESLPIYGGEAAGMLTCPGCGTPHGFEGEGLVALAEAQKVQRPRVPFKLGDKASFDGLDYRLIGHLRLEERDGGVYITDEFLLFNSKRGYRWLTMEAGHFNLQMPLQRQPKTNPKSVKRKGTVAAGPESYKMFERGRMQTTFVDGELPWVAAVGDKLGYMDAIRPPFMLCAEWSENELEWSKCRYLQPREVAAAFKKPLSAMPRRRGIAANQPYQQRAWIRDSGRIAPFFALAMLVLMIWAGMKSGDLAGGTMVTGAQYQDEFLTEAFEIKQAGSLCRIDFHAPVDNSWVYLDGAVVDEQDRVTHDFSAEMSYYHGYSGGESWSEGSRHDSAVMLFEEPGSYRLLLKGQAGVGNSGTIPSSRGQTVSIKIYEGAVLMRFFALLMTLAVIWCLIVWIPPLAFEAKRWSDD